MHQTQEYVPGLVVGCSDVLAGVLEEAGVAGLVPLHQHAGRLPNHQQVIVQVQDFEGRHRTRLSPLSAATR